MKHHEGQAAPESGTDSHTFEDLTTDPEIAALLDFEPVPRQIVKADGWTPAMQRMFIAWLAWYGSPTNACDELGKARSGVDKLYKSADAGEFRGAWDGAIALHEERRIARVASRHGGNGALHAPTLSRRVCEPGNPGEPEDHEPSEEQKLELVEHLAGKFMKKVAAERRARLDGEIVAADFYLRQITMLEVIFDLTASEFGWNAREFLRNLRRADHSPLDIVSTPFADWLDVQRRIWWLQEGDPERPPHPDARFVREHKHGPWGSRGDEGYSTSVDGSTVGAMTTPARGYTPEEWRLMDHDQQRVARQLQFDVDSEEQREWERRAYEEWEASEHAVRARAEWNALASSPRS